TAQEDEGGDAEGGDGGEPRGVPAGAVLDQAPDDEWSERQRNDEGVRLRPDCRGQGDDHRREVAPFALGEKASRGEERGDEEERGHQIVLVRAAVQQRDWNG